MKTLVYPIEKEVFVEDIENDISNIILVYRVNSNFDGCLGYLHEFEGVWFFGTDRIYENHEEVGASPQEALDNLLERYHRYTIVFKLLEFVL